MKSLFHTMQFMLFGVAAYLSSAQEITPLPDGISRIYYLNLDTRSDRREFMHSWLSKQSIPFERVGAMRGTETGCIPSKSESRRCKAISGIIKTMRHIINHLNTSGLTLVLEDDHYVQTDQLMQWVPLVPADWEIIRFDCTLPGGVLPSWIELLTPDKSPNIYRTILPSGSKCNGLNCSFCGGTHTMLWRGGETLLKLRKVWSHRPFDDVDCRLKTPAIKSYCVDAHVVTRKHILATVTDNPKSEANVSLDSN